MNIDTDSQNKKRLEDAIAQLKDADLRVTKPRILLLKLLVSSDVPATIETLFKDVPDGKSDLVTLYRNLNTFEEVGLVRRTFLHNGTATFLHESDGPKFYFVSKTTRRVTALSHAESVQLRHSLEEVASTLKAMGYSGVRHSVQFYVD